MKKVFLVFMFVCIGLLQIAAQSFTYTDDSGVTWGCSVYSSDDKTAQITSASNVGAEVVIPEKVSYGTVEYTVTSIADRLFENNCTIEKVTWASTVTSIPDGIFHKCLKLKAVENTDKVTAIIYNYCDGAFRGCLNLKEIQLPNCKSIGDYAFCDCSNLAAVIGMGNVEAISSNTFFNCTSLQSVDLTNCKSIGIAAFYGCKGLQSVELPKIETLDSQAFYSTGMTKVTLPETLTSMGWDCFSAVDYTFKGNVPPTLSVDNYDAFNGSFTIRVPAEALKAYQTADVWIKYADKIFSLSDKHDYDVTTTALDDKSGLEQAIGATNMKKVISLKVTGTINSYDIFMIRNKMTNLHYLDLSDADIVANNFAYYGDYGTQDNEVGNYMFCNLKNIISLRLPNNTLLILT